MARIRLVTALRSTYPEATSCPICGSPARRDLPAQIAAFIRHRCDLSSLAEARCWLCEPCEHVFLTPVLDNKDLIKLYDGYRDAPYVSERIRFEPDYAAIIGDYKNQDSEHFRRRRGFYDAFHAEEFSRRGLVVDASDGSGYFARYAYPHADVVTLPRHGMPPGTNLPKLLAEADVLMMAHSLQGAPDPVGALRRLSDGLKPGAKVWIETPVEYPGSLRAAFEALEARFARGVRGYGPLQTLHENVAHFSAQSLRRLLQRVGLQPLEFFRSDIGILGVMAEVGREPRKVAAHE